MMVRALSVTTSLVIAAALNVANPTFAATPGAGGGGGSSGGGSTSSAGSVGSASSGGGGGGGSHSGGGGGFHSGDGGAFHAGGGGGGGVFHAGGWDSRSGGGRVGGSRTESVGRSSEWRPLARGAAFAVAETDAHHHEHHHHHFFSPEQSYRRDETLPLEACVPLDVQDFDGREYCGSPHKAAADKVR
jgi:hypothetical protein